jgi:hypothetical protein
MNELPSNWKKEMMKLTDNPVEKKLLRDGATSSTTGMALKALKKRYMKLKGISE